MGVENRSWGGELTTVGSLNRPMVVVRRWNLVGVLRPLALSFLLVAGILLFFLASYPLWPRMYLSPVLDLVPPLAELYIRLFSTDFAHQAVQSTGGNVFFYMYSLAMIVLFAAYLGALHYSRRVRPRRRHFWWLIASASVAGMLLMFAPTLFTSDLYSYVIYGRIASAYGANPLVTPPNKFVLEPVYPLVFWKDTVSVYGPVWVSLSYVLTAIVPPVVAQQVAVFKLVAIVFHIANAGVIWLILDRTSPETKLWGTAAYLWNPLLLIEFGDNGHNDVLMLFFMLLSVLAIVRGHRISPLIFLTASILTKWMGVFLLPIYFVAVLREESDWRGRLSYLLRGGGAMATFATIVYLPYWSGLSTFTAMFNSAAVDRFINSFPELLVRPSTEMLRHWLPSSISKNLSEESTGYLLKIGFGLGFLVVWIRELWSARCSTRTVLPWLRTLFAYLVIACSWFWPWYISWLVPFAALLGWNRWTQATLLFTFSGAFFYSLWPGAPLRPFEPYYDARAAVLFGLPLLYLVASTISDRLRSIVRSRIEA